MDLAALAAEAHALGTRFAFGVPGGGSSLELVTQLLGCGVEFHTTGHETTAALMAGAASRVTGGPALAISIKGPGFVNLAPGLVSNAYEGFPMISISESYPAGPGGARRHKWLDHAAIHRGVGKGIGYLGARAGAAAKAWRLARAEFPGPAHLELADGPDFDAPPPVAAADSPLALEAVLRKSGRPVVVVGSLALRAPWRAALAKLAVPVFTTPAAKGVISETGTWAAGVFTGDGKPATPERRLLPAADRVLLIGVRAGEVLSPPAADDRFLRVDSVSLKGQALFPPEGSGPVSYLDDDGIAAVLAAVPASGWDPAEVERAHREMGMALGEAGWSSARAFETMMGAVPGARHVLDTGNFTVVGEHCLKAATEHDWLGTSNGRFLGMGVGYALGAAAADRTRPTVLWIGDGGIRAFLGELGLAGRLRLPLLTLVMADGRFGSIYGRAAAKGLATAPLVMDRLDVGRVATGLGLAESVAGSAAELERLAQAWRRNPEPALIRCDFEPDRYARDADLLR